MTVMRFVNEYVNEFSLNYLGYFMILHLQKLVREQYEAAKGVSVPKLTDALKTPKLRRTMLLIAFA